MKQVDDADTVGEKPVTPLRVAVIGGGIEGLSTAWFLQEHGCDVTIFERSNIGSGSSHGNAGWLLPSLVAPLPEPSVLGFGLLNVFKRSSPLNITIKPDVKLWRFLAGFMRNCTSKRWRSGTSSLVNLSAEAIDSFQRLKDAGVNFDLNPADPFLACFRHEPDSHALLDELRQLVLLGQKIDFDQVSGAAAIDLSSGLSSAVGHVVRLHGQYFVDPARFVCAVADSFLERRGRILERATVSRVRQMGNVAAVDYDSIDQATSQRAEFDSVVVATGAWLSVLARPLGVRLLVQAGRGYSFSVAMKQLPAGPIYFPNERVACTPLGDRLRIAGMMEFKSVDAPLDPRRIKAIVDAVTPFLDGVDFSELRDEWVGSRPCTPDGLPLVGATRSARIFVNGGHGMWGVTLGPLCGRLLAEQIVSGAVPTQLRPLNPLR
jgi:D-amino-acid dehydrogenase